MGSPIRVGLIVIKLEMNFQDNLNGILEEERSIDTKEVGGGGGGCFRVIKREIARMPNYWRLLYTLQCYYSWMPLHFTSFHFEQKEDEVAHQISSGQEKVNCAKY